jgi:biopolymer transport protein ExbB
MQFSTLAAETLTWTDRISEFYEKGGIIMYVLTFLSVLTLAVILYKALSLARKNIMPVQMRQTMQHYVQGPNEHAADQLAREAGSEGSALARLSNVVIQRSQYPAARMRDAVQAKAHEEMVKMYGGIQVLDVVIVIAPLLGLLGTASGITTVFDGLSSIDDVKMSIMAAGVAEALSTTIAGLAVAVPAVIGHSFFNRKIETYASQLEVALDDLVNAVVEDKDQAA